MNVIQLASHQFSVCRNQTFQRREVLPLHIPQFLRLDSGLIRALTWNENGVVATLGFWGREDIVSPTLFQIQPLQLECLTTVQISELPLGQSYWQKAMLTYATRLEGLVSILHYQSAAERLYRLLHWFAAQFGEALPQGQRVELPLTHQAIAETINTSRVTVTRLLSQFEREGKIQRSSLRQLIIL